jgi:hypothetical protein
MPINEATYERVALDPDSSELGGPSAAGYDHTTLNGRTLVRYGSSAISEEEYSCRTRLAQAACARRQHRIPSVRHSRELAAAVAISRMNLAPDVSAVVGSGRPPPADRPREKSRDQAATARSGSSTPERSSRRGDANRTALHESLYP